MPRKSKTTHLSTQPTTHRFVGEAAVHDCGCVGWPRKYPVILTVYEDPKTGRRGVFSSWPKGKPRDWPNNTLRSAVLRVYHHHKKELEGS